jgi:hypothetical protein
VTSRIGSRCRGDSRHSRRFQAYNFQERGIYLKVVNGTRVHRDDPTDRLGNSVRDDNGLACFAGLGFRAWYPGQH